MERNLFREMAESLSDFSEKQVSELVEEAIKNAVDLDSESWTAEETIASCVGACARIISPENPVKAIPKVQKFCELFDLMFAERYKRASVYLETGGGERISIGVLTEYTRLKMAAE